MSTPESHRAETGKSASPSITESNTSELEKGKTQMAKPHNHVSFLKNRRLKEVTPEWEATEHSRSQIFLKNVDNYITIIFSNKSFHGPRKKYALLRIPGVTMQKGGFVC